MKIQITLEEAKRIVADSLNSRVVASPDLVEVEFVDAPTAPSERLPLPLDELSSAARLYGSIDKIRAIKAVREKAASLGFTVGLGAAKNFVESLKP